jgi:2-hydroxychromene-2-carboxylate isomerase
MGVSRFHPVFLGGINVKSGNKPPWSLPAKARYGEFDYDRAKKYFGATDIQTPSFFPILSILVRIVLPMQCTQWSVSGAIIMDAVLIVHVLP